MRRNTLTFRVLAIILCLSAFVAPISMAATPAGTQITVSGTAQYYSSSGAQMPTVTSNTVTTTVGQLASVSVSPTTASKPGTPGTVVDFPITVTNLGNGSDSYGFSTSASAGSAVTIYKDDNGDGVRQSTEVTKETASSILSAGGTCKCFVTAQLPSGATTDAITLLATSKYDAAKSAKATFSIQDGGQVATYMRDWLVNGYYTNTNHSTRLSTDYLGGEASVAPTEGTVTAGKTWSAVQSTTDKVDLVAKFGAQTYCAGYAHVYVYSPSAQSANLWLGSDNGIKVWLNGANVWTNDSTRGLTPDQDKVGISLKAGWNRLLLKISQYGGNWGFTAKICTSTGGAIKDLQFALQPPQSDTGAPVISNFKVTPSETSAIVEWDTNEASSSEVNYGTTSALGTSAQGTGNVTHHVVNLTGLTAATTYQLKVGSTDAAGNTAWAGPHTFTTTNEPAPAVGYVRNWLVNGYYTNTNNSTRLSTDYLGGEASVVPAANTVTAGKTWSGIQSTTDKVDLVSKFGAQIYCAGYAHVYVYSPSAQSAYLWLGSDNGIKVWLNGQNVWTNDSTRGLTPDQDKVGINLTAGWNRLLLKISQYGGNWGFTAKICKSTGDAVQGLQYSLQSPEGDTTTPVISDAQTTFVGSTSVTIEWDTDEAANTMLDYGVTALDQAYDDNTMVTHHKATLTNLTPGTKYAVKVGSSDAAGNTAWDGPYNFTTAVQSEEPPVNTDPYIKSWLLNGYYTNTSSATRLATDYLGGEASAAPLPNTQSANGFWWFQVDSATNVVDLAKAMNYPSYCAGYAFTYVYSPVAQTVNMWMGSDDGVKVWLNGELVWMNDIYRGCTDGRDRTSVDLAEGWNRLLVKISQGERGWKFVLRLCDSSGNAIPNLYYSTSP